MAKTDRLTYVKTLKRTCIIILTVFMVLLTGCVKEEIKAEDDEFIICIDFSELKDPVYRMDISYFLEGDLMGGLAVSEIKERKLDSPVCFHFLKENFPEGSDRKSFSFHLVLSGSKEGISDMFSEAEVMAHTDQCAPFDPENGNVYHYKISGNYQDGLILIRR